MIPNNTIQNVMASIGNHIALTFDDIILVPGYSECVPGQVNLQSQFSRNIKLNIPLVSAAMDSVTESQMAIAMALMGGMGVIHKNLTPEEQVREVKKVKYFLNGFLEKVRVVFPHQTVEEVLRYREEKGFSFSSFPVVDEKRHLLGIITRREIKYCDDTKLSIEDIMLKDPIISKGKCSLLQAYKIMKKHRISILPVVENNRLSGIYCWKDVRDIVHTENPSYNRDEHHRLRCGAAVGPHDHERVEMLIESGVDCLVVDTAHGHTANVLEIVRWLKKHYTLDIVVGNIAHAEAVRDLIRAGADAIKVGIGPGSICTTRVVTGIGVPQVSAVYDCAMAAQGEIPIIADGGIRFSGDVAKVLAVGADSVMMGNVLAGTDESPGEIILFQGRKYVSYRGMGSLEAMQERSGSRERYSQAEDSPEKLVPEGIVGMVPYTGTVREILIQFTGGLRSTLGYTGSENIPAFREKARIRMITSSGQTENHPHDVIIRKESPNYKGIIHDTPGR